MGAYYMYLHAYPLVAETHSQPSHEYHSVDLTKLPRNEVLLVSYKCFLLQQGLS